MLALSGALAGCGAGHDQATAAIPGRTLDLYVSVPLEGTSAVTGRDVLDGAQMAVDQVHARIGRYRIALKRLDDASVARGEWDPGQTSNNLRVVAADPAAVGYVGDLNSGASAISIPVLNRIGLAQISPASTAVGLTSAASGAEPGEPEKYYPTGVRTFARVAASDTAQAAVQVSLQHAAGCKRMYVVQDGEVDGEDMATTYVLAARSAGLDVVATQQFDRRATNYTALVTNVLSTGADCVMIAAIADSNAILLTEQLAAGSPRARIFATGGMAESSYSDPALGGIPLSLDGRVTITSAGLGASAYPEQGQQLLAAYAMRYGAPEPDAILGYEATSLLLSAISRATNHGLKPARRAAVVQAVFATHDRSSVVGRYSIESDGDTSSGTIGVWRIVGGRLRFARAIDA